MAKNVVTAILSQSMDRKQMALIPPPTPTPSTVLFLAGGKRFQFQQTHLSTLIMQV